MTKLFSESIILPKEALLSQMPRVRAALLILLTRTLPW